MKKKLMIILSVISILSPTVVFAEDEYTTAPSPSTVSTNSTNSIMPLSDVIVWKFKVVEGKTYRRRYNSTKKQWIGEWELVP